MQQTGAAESTTIFPFLVPGPSRKQELFRVPPPMFTYKPGLVWCSQEVQGCCDSNDGVPLTPDAWSSFLPLSLLVSYDHT